MILDLRDFDETLPGPFKWALLRLIANFEVAGPHKGFTLTLRATPITELDHPPQGADERV